MAWGVGCLPGAASPRPRRGERRRDVQYVPLSRLPPHTGRYGPCSRRSVTWTHVFLLVSYMPLASFGNNFAQLARLDLSWSAFLFWRRFNYQWVAPGPARLAAGAHPADPGRPAAAALAQPAARALAVPLSVALTTATAAALAVAAAAVALAAPPPLAEPAPWHATTT